MQFNQRKKYADLYRYLKRNWYKKKKSGGVSFSEEVSLNCLVKNTSNLNYKLKYSHTFFELSIEKLMKIE